MPSATESAGGAPCVRYQPVQDLTGKVVAVRAVPAPLDRLEDAAVHLQRWRSSPAHQNLRLYLASNEASSLLQGREETGLRLCDLIIDITSLAPFTDEIALNRVEQARADGALTAVDTTNPNLGKLVDLLGLPLDLIMVGHCVIGEQATDPGHLALTEAAIRIGQALHSSVGAEMFSADAVDTLLADRRNDADRRGSDARR